MGNVTHITAIILVEKMNGIGASTQMTHFLGGRMNVSKVMMMAGRGVAEMITIDSTVVFQTSLVMILIMKLNVDTIEATSLI